VTPDEATGLSKLMQRLGRRYVGWFNEVHGRRGTLWDGRFRSCIAEDEGYVLACHRSIECNPVHAGMVADPLGYPWSSHAAHARGPSSPLLTPHPQMLSLGAEPGARRVAYRALFDETLDADLLDADLLGATRDATNGNYVLGSARFRDRIAETLGLRVSHGKSGRRRKGATG
jgi:putative transposase